LLHWIVMDTYHFCFHICCRFLEVELLAQMANTYICTDIYSRLGM
jgi:hypothetical protein